MREDVLKSIGQLEGVHLTQTVLYVGVNHQLGETQDLATQLQSGSIEDKERTTQKPKEEKKNN
jgi:hypothetical protein